MGRNPLSLLIPAIACLILFPMLCLAATPDGVNTDEETSYTLTCCDSILPQVPDLPLRGAEDLTTLFPGTTTLWYKGPIYLRGGESGELRYRVDGIPQEDPFTGESRVRVNGSTISSVRLNPDPSEPLSLPVLSGVADVVTFQAGHRWHGSLEGISDDFHGDSGDYRLLAGSLSGPLLPRDERLTLALAGEHRTVGNRDPGGPGSWNWLSTWQGKLQWTPSPRLEARLMGLGSYRDSKSVPSEYLFDAEHGPRTVERYNSLAGTVTHSPSDRVTYSATGFWQSTDQRQGDGVYFDNLWGYGRPGGNPRFDGTSLFWSWDDMALDPDSLAVGRQVPLHTPVVESTYVVPLPDGDSVTRSFVIRGDEGSVYDDYVHYNASCLGSQFNLSDRIGQNHEISVGADLRRYTIRLYHNLFPVRIYMGDEGGLHDLEAYGYDLLGNESNGANGAKHPLDVGAYVQHRAQFGEVTATWGLRLDHFDYDADALINEHRPLDPYDYATYADTASGLTQDERDSLRLEAQQLTDADLTPARTHTLLSPRIGLTFALRENTQLHASFSRHVQRPAFSDVFADYRFLEMKVRTGGYAYTFGNASLEPEEVWQTEIGLRHGLRNRGFIAATAFYKDFSHLLGYSTVAATPNSVWMRLGTSSGVARGLELLGAGRLWDGLAVQASYTLQGARASSTEPAPTNIGWTNSGEGGCSYAARPFDRRHTFTGAITWEPQPHAESNSWSAQILRGAYTGMVIAAASGFPYTPMETYNEVTLGNVNPLKAGEVNSERATAVFRLDLKVGKRIPIGSFVLDAYVWVINLFDRDNATYVYQSTGEPDETGWLATNDGRWFAEEFPGAHDTSYLSGEEKYNLREDDPANLDIPRQIRAGVSVRF